MTKTTQRPTPTQPPARFRKFGKKHAAIMRAYESLGEATAEAGPLGAKTRCLVKLAIASLAVEFCQNDLARLEAVAGPTCGQPLPTYAH